MSQKRTLTEGQSLGQEITGLFSDPFRVVGLGAFATMLESFETVHIGERNDSAGVAVFLSPEFQPSPRRIPITDADINHKAAEIRNADTIMPAFDGNVIIDPEDTTAVHNEATLRALHLGLAKMAFGATVRAERFGLSMQDNVFYRTSHDLIRLAMPLSGPIHTDEEIMPIQSQEKFAVNLYNRAFARLQGGYIAGEDGGISTLLKDEVEKSLAQMLYVPTAFGENLPDIYQTEESLEVSRKLKLLLGYFNERDDLTAAPATLKSIEKKGVDEEVRRVITVLERSDSKYGFVKTAIETYFEDLNLMQPNVLTEKIIEELSNPEATIVTIIEITNRLRGRNNNDPDGPAPKASLSTTPANIAVAFNVLRTAIAQNSDLQIEKRFPYMKHLGDLISTILVTSFPPPKIPKSDD